MNRTTPTLLLVSALLAGGLLPGCNQPRRLESNTRERLATTDGLDVDDTLRAADALTESLLNSPALTGEPPLPVIAVSTFVNRTNQDVDRDAVLKQVRAAISRSGLAKMQGVFEEDSTTTAVALDNQRRAEEDAFLTGLQTGAAMRDARAIPNPDYSLTLKLLDARARSDFGSRELTYRFQMTLTDTSDATVAWEDEEIITKQRRAFGF